MVTTKLSAERERQFAAYSVAGARLSSGPLAPVTTPRWGAAEQLRLLKYGLEKFSGSVFKSIRNSGHRGRGPFSLAYC